MKAEWRYEDVQQKLWLRKHYRRVGYRTSYSNQTEPNGHIYYA